MYSTRFNGCQKNKGDHEANPTVMVIQQWSKQSYKCIGKMLNFSVKKRDYSLTS
jgi:hypothetical protein